MLKHLLSMKMAVLVLFVFGVSAGVATFIENDYGTQTAQALVYKAEWFEYFLTYFIAILIFNMTRYKTYKTKPSVFLFHFSFLIIALGALTTRYMGYEGVMHIREGEKSNLLVSNGKFLQVVVHEVNQSSEGEMFEKELYLSSMSENSFHQRLEVGDKEVEIDLVRYLPAFQESVVDDPKGQKMIELKVSNGRKGEMYAIATGETKTFDQFDIAYNAPATKDKPTLLIEEREGNLTMSFPYIINTMRMDDRSTSELQSGVHSFEKRTLYQFGQNAVVLKEIYPHAHREIKADGLKTQSQKPEYIAWQISVGDKTKTIVTTPIKDEIGDISSVTLDGVKVDLRVGAKVITLPFALRLEKFKLERYPGSMTPSSYASDVTLIDDEKNITMPYAIYMNHVLDYRGYRFFQSSYDPDEKGTVLSVNNDPGTPPTYLGYLLLTIGMFWSLLSKNGRFRLLTQRTKTLQKGVSVAVALLFFVIHAPAYATSQPTIEQLEAISLYDKVHSEAFGRLIVQDIQGRMKPIDTIAREVLAKISSKSSLFGVDSTQILLGMVIEPTLFQELPMIKIGHPKIAVMLGLDEHTQYAKFSDFFDKQKNSYILYEEITKASMKKPIEQSQYDKKLLEIDEKVNVSYMVYSGSLLRIFPIPHDKNNKWLAPADALQELQSRDTEMIRLIVANYFQSVESGVQTNKWEEANKALSLIEQFQKSFGATVMPSSDHIEMEILYNQLGVFGKLVPYYLLLGFVILILAFVRIFKKGSNFEQSSKLGLQQTALATGRSYGIYNLIAVGLLGVGFAIHIIGLAIRWYISGHAPWSNAYESIVFIALATVLAGLLLARKSPFALAGASILAGITMGVAHMNFINPEITNLVPVLKSYWLMVHVATIISGDGFLGLGSILSLIVMVLFVIRNKGKESVDNSIKELTNLSEMSLMIGLVLLTVGNFLGGVWANESWGRYWGWDPKETWAAVTILIYATVLHLRFIPSMKSIFIYNLFAMWAYSTVLMTYFGVNYYLSGLHSYAAGDPVPVPMWVYYAVGVLLLLTFFASRNRKIL